MNFIKALFPENQQITQFCGIRNIKIRKLRNIRDKIPQIWQNKIVNSRSSFITVFPNQIINLQDKIRQNLRIKTSQNRESSSKISEAGRG